MGRELRARAREREDGYDGKEMDEWRGKKKKDKKKKDKEKQKTFFPHSLGHKETKQNINRV